MLIRTLWGFFHRDMNIHTSYKFGFIFELFSVFFDATTFYFVSKIFGGAAVPSLKPYGGDYFSFVLIGIAFANYQQVGLNAFSQSIRQEQYLNTLEPLMLTPVSIGEFLLGSALWDFFYATLQVGLYLAVGVMVYGLNLPNAQVGPALAVLALTIFAMMGLGVLSAAFIMRFKRGNPVTWFVATASELLGGVLFPVAMLPEGLKKISQIIPMTHALEGLRKTLLSGAGWKDVSPQMGALAIFIAVLWPLGVLAFSLALRRSRADGTLGHY